MSWFPVPPTPHNHNHRSSLKLVRSDFSYLQIESWLQTQRGARVAVLRAERELRVRSGWSRESRRQRGGRRERGTGGAPQEQTECWGEEVTRQSLYRGEKHEHTAPRRAEKRRQRPWAHVGEAVGTGFSSQGSRGGFKTEGVQSDGCSQGISQPSLSACGHCCGKRSPCMLLPWGSSSPLFTGPCEAGLHPTVTHPSVWHGTVTNT